MADLGASLEHLVPLRLNNDMLGSNRVRQATDDIGNRTQAVSMARSGAFSKLIFFMYLQDFSGLGDSKTMVK